MRYRLMATYLGVPYHAGLGPDGNEATLFSPGPPPDELGFTAAGGHWRKQVSVTDLDALWQSRLVGEYRGEPCLVLDDLADRLHIVYLGRDSVRARQLGYWEIDREVFEVVVAPQEVTGLTEERVEYPLASAMFPPSNRDPVPLTAQPRPEAPGRGASAPQTPGGPPPSVTERTSPLRVVPWPDPRPSAEPGEYAEAGGYAHAGGYAGADRVSSTPDRAAAWHGSPETEPWSERRPDLRADPRSESRPDPGLIPGPSHGRIAGLSPGSSLDRGLSLSRRPPRRPGGAPGGGTGYPSLSLPNSSAWPPSRTRRMRSMRRCRAPCAWSRRTAASRCSAVLTTPGWMCASSKTRKRPTSTCLGSWRRKRCGAGDCAPAHPTGAPTDRAGLGCPRPGQKVFRSTYGAGSYPNHHLIQLSLI